MKRAWVVLVLLLAPSVLSAFAQGTDGGFAASNKANEQSRSITGQVLTADDQPIASAVVYLKNTKTLAIKSFITEKDGGYRFHALSPNVDYEVYAEYDGHKSSTKVLSAFDTRANITMHLHIDVKK